MVKVTLENVTKKFGDVTAADNVNLTINDGEFFTFLGPSGCGKTTSMRMIAGLEGLQLLPVGHVSPGRRQSRCLRGQR